MRLFFPDELELFIEFSQRSDQKDRNYDFLTTTLYVGSIEYTPRFASLHYLQFLKIYAVNSLAERGNNS